MRTAHARVESKGRTRTVVAVRPRRLCVHHVLAFVSLASPFMPVRVAVTQGHVSYSCMDYYP